MTLTLSVLRCPDAVPPETKRINGGELRIGRGPDNDWIMPDPDKMLSKRHCVVAFRNGAWAIADTSTNGTYLNRDADPLGTGQVRGLEDGDRIRIGAYEIEVRIAEETAFAPAPQAGFGARPRRLTIRSAMTCLPRSRRRARRLPARLLGMIRCSAARCRRAPLPCRGGLIHFPHLRTTRFYRRRRKQTIRRPLVIPSARPR
jgi:hypothetical protein